MKQSSQEILKELERRLREEIRREEGPSLRDVLDKLSNIETRLQRIEARPYLYPHQPYWSTTSDRTAS